MLWCKSGQIMIFHETLQDFTIHSESWSILEAHNWFNNLQDNSRYIPVLHDLCNEILSQQSLLVISIKFPHKTLHSESWSIIEAHNWFNNLHDNSWYILVLHDLCNEILYQQSLLVISIKFPHKTLILIFPSSHKGYFNDDSSSQSSKYTPLQKKSNASFRGSVPSQPLNQALHFIWRGV